MVCSSNNGFSARYTLQPLDGWVDVSALLDPATFLSAGTTATLATADSDTSSYFQAGDKIRLSWASGAFFFAIITSVTFSTVTLTSTASVCAPNQTLPAGLPTRVWHSRSEEPMGWPDFFSSGSTNPSKTIELSGRRLDGWTNVTNVFPAGYLATQLQSVTTLATSSFDATLVFKKGDKLKLVSTLGKISYVFITAVAVGSITFISGNGTVFSPNPALTGSDNIAEVWMSRESNPLGWPSFFWYNAVTAGRISNVASGSLFCRFNIGESNVVDFWFHTSNLVLTAAAVLIAMNYPVGITPSNNIGFAFPYCDTSGSASVIQNGPFIAQVQSIADFQVLVINILKSDATVWAAGVPYLIHGLAKIPI